MFGDNLKKYRKKCGLSQSALAKKLSVSQQTIGSWEINRTSPPPEMIKALSDILNVSADKLLGKTKNSIFLEAKNKEDEDLLNKTLNELLEQQDGVLFFEGKPLDDETKQLLIASLRNTMRMAKAMNERDKKDNK